MSETAFARPIDRETFRLIAGHWVTGVSVVTTVDANGNPVGLTMNAVSSLSLNPPQFLICMDNHSDSLRALLGSRVFCINYLSQRQLHIAKMFSRKSADKFAEIAFRRLSNGLPIIEGGVGFVACKVAAVLPGGDHQIIVGDVECAEATEREPLVHYRGMYHRLFPIT